MRLLLDTHLFLWWLSADKRLSVAANDVIVDRANEKFVSAASLWEIAIKVALRRLDISHDQMEHAMQANGFAELPITGRHAAQVASLPFHHRDPFDRMLIAQSLVEPLHLMTHDEALTHYSNTVMLV